MPREYAMGRLYSEDVRDRLFPYSAIVPFSQTTRTKRFWWSNGWWGDQGYDPHCVAFSWAHWIADGPKLTSIFRTRNPGVDTHLLYCEAQKRDPWPGDCDTPLYDGTSVRAGAKVLEEWGYIEEYRWATDAQQAVNAVLTQGPVIVGTMWYSDMFYPNRNTWIVSPTGSMAGGHAYVLNGVDTERGLFRIKNSWGPGWGRGGHAYIRIEDMDKLIKNYGEACVPLQKKFEE